MNLAEYLAKKKIEAEKRKPRDFCATCLRALRTCYCARVQAFDPHITFVLLIHWREAQKKIATGRLTHHLLEHSLLIPGYDYSADPKVNALLQNETNHCLVLYPGAVSSNLTKMSESERGQLCSDGKRLVVFVIDGTWVTARKTVKRSTNLRNLPRISFCADRKSNFRVRKQPKADFFSTIEAVHEVIELLGPSRGFSLVDRKHDRLLEVFDEMIDQQIALSKQPKRPYLKNSQKKKKPNSTEKSSVAPFDSL